MATTKIPPDQQLAGHMRNAQGHLVPIDVIKPIDLTRDELVRDLVAKAMAMNEALAKFKDDAMAQADNFIALSAAQYKVALGGKKGNVTLMSFDGRYKILLAVAESITFDERLQAAKALVDECVRDWAKDARPELQAIVNDAFQTDQAGKINTGRILALRRLDIQDKRWQQAMKAIGESTQVVGSKRYLRFYERVGDSDQYEAIPLDIAGV